MDDYGKGTFIVGIVNVVFAGVTILITGLIGFYGFKISKTATAFSKNEYGFNVLSKVDDLVSKEIDAKISRGILVDRRHTIRIDKLNHLIDMMDLGMADCTDASQKKAFEVGLQLIIYNDVLSIENRRYANAIMIKHMDPAGLRKCTLNINANSDKFSLALAKFIQDQLVSGHFLGQVNLVSNDEIDKKLRDSSASFSLDYDLIRQRENALKLAVIINSFGEGNQYMQYLVYHDDYIHMGNDSDLNLWINTGAFEHDPVLTQQTGERLKIFKKFGFLK
jgi:hypothetical protein